MVKQLEHPYADGYPLRPRTADCLARMLALGPEGVRSWRRQEWERIKGLAQSLDISEKKLHKHLHPDVEKVVARKKLLVFKRLLADIDFEDLDAAASMATGFPVVWGPSGLADVSSEGSAGKR